MDIIDIILSRAKSFTGETKALTEQAKAAMSDANEIVERLEAIQQDATEASESAIAAAETFENMISFEDTSTAAAKELQTTITKGEDVNTYTVEKNYTSYGDNEDGSMTQKAIKQYVSSVKEELEQEMANTGTNLGQDNAGTVVIVGPDGTIAAGDTTEQQIIEALIKSGSYTAKNGVGIEIDYENKSAVRTQEAKNKVAGVDFNAYSMYGGRMRCNVADNGVILSFYGDNSYRDDGSNGQVMVYQPKFYYQRIPMKTADLSNGAIIKKESIIISATPQAGFKLHPLFKTVNGEELNYVLLPAYDGGIYDTSESAYKESDTRGIDFTEDVLSSVAGVKPVSGVNNALTIDKAEQLANNRGEGWHITNMAAESAIQMLEMIEFGTMNLQANFEFGFTNIADVTGANKAATTGSTASLGNVSGYATTTVCDGTSYSSAGYRAISYRGMENPWGNILHMVGGANVVGEGNSSNIRLYICKNFNYNVATTTNDYKYIGFPLASNSNWISGMGYGDAELDWVFAPAEASNANSALPVGDYYWSAGSLNGINIVTMGGVWSHREYAGPFSFGSDNKITSAYRGVGAKLMFIPSKNSIYEANYSNWLRRTGG